MVLTSDAAMAKRRLACLRLLLLLVLLLSPALAATSGEEPGTPECRRFAKGDLSFCSMVDYTAVVDAEDRDGAAADARAKFYYENVHVLLLRFGCHNKYSLYGCDDCRDAYKYWVCSIKFQKCGASDASDADELASRLCPLSSSTNDGANCVEGATGRHRTCRSLCEDVVRKCPYVLNFQCPTVSRHLSRPWMRVADSRALAAIPVRDNLLLDRHLHVQQAGPLQEPRQPRQAVAGHLCRRVA
jgi:hypothetical protein